MHAYLQRSDVLALLEGATPPTSAQGATHSVARGEVLKRAPLPPGPKGLFGTMRYNTANIRTSYSNIVYQGHLYCVARWRPLVFGLLLVLSVWYVLLA